ncbi:hypothetical protein N2152v2_005676 [Parachlorella kessleri]
MPLGRPEYDSEDEDQPTLAQLRAVPVVVCPKPAAASYAALMGELEMVGRDGPDDPIRMLNTSSSYEGHEILTRYRKAVDKLLYKKDWPEAFTQAVVLLKAAKEEEFWYMDTDDPEAVGAIVEKMDHQWGKLFTRTDEELGGVSQDDRQAVDIAWEELKGQIADYCTDP